MKHLNSLALITLLSLSIYFSSKNAINPNLFGNPFKNETSFASNQAVGLSNIQYVSKDFETLGEWQVILNETFEGTWPSSRWAVVDLRMDFFDRKWGTDEYRAHSPSIKAAWPACAGSNGRDPSPFNNDYFNNMDTRMIFGPFDLPDAGMMEINFWVWWETETNFDYLSLEISEDNKYFKGLGRWDGTSDGWREKNLSTIDYAGKSSVWVSWRFTSNDSNVFDGPWVDDVLLIKYLPGQVTSQGILSYIDRKNNSTRASFTKAYLYDSDPGEVDDLLAVTTTDSAGVFAFTPLTNWDADDDDPDPNKRKLDLYVIWEAEYNDSGTSQHRVTKINDQTYRWQSYTWTNAPDGTIDFSSTIPVSFPGQEAMWIFQDLRHAWIDTYTKTYPPYDPGSVTAKWENDKNSLSPCIGSCFYGFGPYVFIADRNTISSDTVIHEIGHNHMFTATGWWLWWNISCYYH